MLISFAGTVTRTGMVKMVTKEKRFKCKRCATDFTVPYSFSAGDIPKPIKCPSGGAECGAKSLEEQKVSEVQYNQECDLHAYTYTCRQRTITATFKR